jgi:hypothetical protein
MHKYQPPAADLGHGGATLAEYKERASNLNAALRATRGRVIDLNAKVKRRAKNKAARKARRAA